MISHDVTWPYRRCFKYLHIFKSIQLELTTRQPPEERHPGLWMQGGTLLALDLECGTQACSVLFEWWAPTKTELFIMVSYIICVYSIIQHLVLLSLRLHRNGVLHHHASYLCQVVMSSCPNLSQSFLCRTEWRTHPFHTLCQVKSLMLTRSVLHPPANAAWPMKEIPWAPLQITKKCLQCWEPLDKDNQLWSTIFGGVSMSFRGPFPNNFQHRSSCSSKRFGAVPAIPLPTSREIARFIFSGKSWVCGYGLIRWIFNTFDMYMHICMQRQSDYQWVRAREEEMSACKAHQRFFSKYRDIRQYWNP